MTFQNLNKRKISVINPLNLNYNTSKIKVILLNSLKNMCKK